jgi:hypothetical protein
MQLKEPEEYMPTLERLRERNKYANNWKLRIEKRTNRHREPGGGYWGWYEVHPLEEHIAYWGTRRDNMKGVDLEEWNRRAEIISMANKDHNFKELS